MSNTVSRAQSVDLSDAAAPIAGLLDTVGVAVRLGVTHRFVRRLVEERRIPFHKIGRLVRFDPVEVEQWIRQQRVEPRPVVPPQSNRRR